MKLRVSEQLPRMVSNELATLSPDSAMAFREEYRRRSKSTAVCYLLWLCLGWHYAYLRKWGIQVLFWLSAGGLIIWWLIDLFRIPGLIENYNRDTAIAAMRDLKAISR
jgi:hypothetical protein